MKTKESACLFYMDDETRLILAVSRKFDPNDFGLPGGKKEYDETLEECVIRETKEETGLEVFNPIPVFKAPIGSFTCTTFIPGFIKGKPFTKEQGVIDVVDVQKLLHGSFGRYNYQLFKHLKII